MTQPVESKFHLQALPTKDGKSTLEVISPDGRKSLLHSKYAPVDEAKRLVESFKIDPLHNIIVLGIGLGYHVIEILDKPNNRDFMLVVEKNPNILRAFLKTHDISKNIASDSIRDRPLLCNYFCRRKYGIGPEVSELE